MEKKRRYSVTSSNQSRNCQLKRSKSNQLEVVNSLLSKYKRTQSKLLKRRLKNLKRENKSIQAKPRINLVSHLLSTRNRDLPKKRFSFIKKSKLKPNNGQPKKVEVSLGKIKPSTSIKSRTSAAHRMFKDYISKEIQEEKYSRMSCLSSLESIEALREAVRKRPNVLEPEEPPESKSFVERSMQWLSSKNSKLEKQRQEKEKQETANCTFTPRNLRVYRSASPRLEIPSKVKFLKNDKKSEKSSVKTCDTLKNSANKRITSLSPKQQVFSFKSGMDMNHFIKKSSPLLRYF